METKGKWMWKQNRGNNYYEHSVFVQDGMSDKVIAELSGEGCTKDEVKDNARLIAAAPEFARALKRIGIEGKREKGNYDRYDARGFVRIAEDALAQVK